MKTKNITIITASLSGALLTICGIVMAFNGLSSSGSIDIKSSLLSGRIETGSLGLLFTFLGVFLLGVCVLVKRETYTSFRRKTNNQEYNWSRWETGDPYVDLMIKIFPTEKTPEQACNLPVIDWISEASIMKMIDEHLSGELINKIGSFISYFNLKKSSIKNNHDSKLNQVLQYIKISVTAKNSDLEFTHIEVDNEGLNEIVFMIESTIGYYFVNKKRIFAGWNKYPDCSPPIHTELEEWINKSEKKWMDKLAHIKKIIDE